MSAVQILLKGERDDLAKLIRSQEKVAKSSAAARSADLLAEFEEQMASTYRFDQDAVWKQAYAAADAAIRQAQLVVADRCRELGIPQEFSPGLDMRWYQRGENAMKERRDELRRVARTRIEAMEKAARREIERISVEAQTRVIVSGITSEAAHAMLATLPQAADLMPAVSITDIEMLLPGMRRRREEENAALISETTALLEDDSDPEEPDTEA